jgi:polyphosphate kinase 2 (PPK2 family)
LDCGQSSAVPIELTKFERGLPFPGDYHAALEALQDRLSALQLAQIVHRRRAIILFEGWEGAGKKAALKQLAAAWDPCHFTTHSVAGSASDDSDRHWLARFWATLPPAACTTLFYRSWYRKAVDDRALGRGKIKDWARAYDEINEFESQQRDHGTLIVKLFFHISAAVQEQRLRERSEDSWGKWLIEPEDQRKQASRDAYLGAWQDIFAHTDTRWAPWHVIDANDEHSARIAALSVIVEALEKAIPLEPPSDGDNVVMLAQQRRQPAQSG